MANTRLGLFNYLLNPGVILKNGTGGGAPALIEQAPYVMSNLLNGDRYSIWKSSVLSSASNYNIDFDLGDTMPINAAGMHGYRLATGEGPGIDVFYQTGAYTPAGSWTAYGNFAGFLRDEGTIGSTVSARSVRFRIAPTAASESFSVGSFFVGELDDLGGIHSPGGVRVPFQNRLETPLASGAVVLTRLGDSGVTWTMPWNSIPTATRSKFVLAQGRPTSFTMVDADDKWNEMFLRGGSLTEGRTGGPGVFDVSIELVSLP